MSKKMQKALLAFINEDVDQAKKLLRQVFIESAQKVNKELEEQFDAEEIAEDVDQDPEADLEGEVEYKLDEGWGEWDDEQPVEEAAPVEDEEVSEFSADEEPESDFPMGDESSEEVAVDVEVDGDKFKEMQEMIDELSEIFDSLQSGEEEVSMDGSDEFGAEEEPESDEFADVSMGDEKVGESYKMKPVAAPEKSEKAGGNKKSPVAPNAKSPVEGVKPVQIKDGHVETSDKAFKNSDTESVKVEDNNNVMDSAKGMMKDVQVPKHTAEKSRSPLPKQK